MNNKQLESMLVAAERRIAGLEHDIKYWREHAQGFHESLCKYEKEIEDQERRLAGLTDQNAKLSERAEAAEAKLAAAPANG